MSDTKINFTYKVITSAGFEWISADRIDTDGDNVILYLGKDIVAFFNKPICVLRTDNFKD